MRKLTVVSFVALLSAGSAVAEEHSRASIWMPAEITPGCFAGAVRLPREVVERLPRVVNVVFTVSDDGSVRNVATGDASLGLATQLRGALSRCAWVPGADETGVPVAVRVSMPVKFELSSRAPGAVAAKVDRLASTGEALAVR